MNTYRSLPARLEELEDDICAESEKPCSYAREAALIIDIIIFLFLHFFSNTVCPRSLDPFYIVSYLQKRGMTPWTNSIHIYI